MDEKTNEILEVIQTIIDNKEKDKKNTNLSPFWKEGLEKDIYLERAIYHNNQHLNPFISFRCKTDYIPLCCLTKLFYDGYNLLGSGISKLQFNENSFVFDNYVPPEFRPYFNKLQRKNFTSMLIYGNADNIMRIINNGGTNINSIFKSSIITTFYNWINFNPSDLYRIPNVCVTVPKSAITIVKKSISVPVFGLGIVPNQGSYLYGHYFCGKIIDHGLQSINPLYCLMVKKEYINYVKACIFANVRINPEALEMWINKDIDNPKSENNTIRTRFNGIIKKDLKEKGISIRVIENLSEELLNLPKKITFNSIKERKDFIDDIINKEISKEKIRLGIVDSPEEIDSVIESILDNISPEEQYPF